MSLCGRCEYVDMRRVHESCCAMTKVASVETSCLSRKPRFIRRSLETVRSHIAYPHSRERIHRRQTSLSDAKVGFVASLLIARFRSTVSRDLILYSNSEGPPLLVLRHRPYRADGAAAHGPSFFAPARHSSLVRHVVAVGGTHPRAHPGILKACTRLAYTCLRYSLLQSSTPAGASYYSFVCTAGEMVVVPIRSLFLVDSSHSSGSHRFSRPGVPCQAL